MQFRYPLSGSSHSSFAIIRSIRSINPAVAVLTLLTLGNAQTRLALLSLTRKVRVQKRREPTPVSPLTSYILHLTSRRSSLQLPASRTAALVATLVVATLGDVLLARSSGSSLRVNLLPTHRWQRSASETSFALVIWLNENVPIVEFSLV